MKKESKQFVNELITSLQNNKVEDGRLTPFPTLSYSKNQEGIKKHSHAKRFLAAAASLAAFCTTYALILPAITLEERFEFGMSSQSQSIVGTPSKTAQSMDGVILTGDASNDLVSIAETQVGYQESDEDYFVTVNNETKGYTPYGAWYGDSYGDWSATFVSFCMENANISSDVFPYESNPVRWIEKLSDETIQSYQQAGTYTPKKGDLVFFKKGETDKSATSVGIVSKVEEVKAAEDPSASQSESGSTKDSSTTDQATQNAEPATKSATNETAGDTSEQQSNEGKTHIKIEVIEGDYENTVSRITYALEDPQIVGFASLASTIQIANTRIAQPVLQVNANTVSSYSVNSTTPEEGTLEYWQALFVQAGAEDYLYTLDEETIADYNQDPDFANKTDEERIALIRELFSALSAQSLSNDVVATNANNYGAATKAGDSGSPTKAGDPASNTTTVSNRIFWKIEEVDQGDGTKVATLKLRNDLQEGYTELDPDEIEPWKGKGSFKKMVVETPIKRGDYKFSFSSTSGASTVEGLENIDMSGCTSMRDLFKGCKWLTNTDFLSSWDVSSVTDMSGMFQNTGIKQVKNGKDGLEGISGWDVSNVTDMSYMFYRIGLNNTDALSNWNTSSVTNLEGTFSRNSDYSFTLDGLANWDVSNVINMKLTFNNWIPRYYGTDFTPLANWDVSNVTNMDSTFRNCGPMRNLSALKNWNVSNVTTMASLFEGSLAVSLNGLENWDVSNVTDMRWMFAHIAYKSDLTDISALSNWNTSSLQSTQNMFYNRTGITSLDALENWDTSSLTNISEMFYCCHGLKDISGIGKWDTSSLMYASKTFHTCKSLEDATAIKDWDTSQVVSVFAMFRDCFSLKTVDMSNWNLFDVGFNVTWEHSNNAREMFAGCSNLQRIVTPKDAPGDIAVPTLAGKTPGQPILFMEEDTGITHQSIPPHNLVLVRFDNALFTGLSDTMVLITKKVNGSSVNLPRFGFKIFYEDGTPVQKDPRGGPAIFFSDASGRVSFDASALPEGRYYVEEVTTEEEMKNHGLTYDPNMTYDTSRKWFTITKEPSDVSAVLKNALDLQAKEKEEAEKNGTEWTPRINVNAYSMTIKDGDNEDVFASTIMCGWEGQKYPDGPVSDIKFFGSSADMPADRNYTNELTTLRGGTSPYRPADHGNVPVTDALRYIMYTSANQDQMQQSAWALLNKGEVTIDPDVLASIPSDFQFAFAAAPGGDQQPLLISLKSRVKTEELVFNNTKTPPPGDEPKEAFFKIDVVKKDGNGATLSGATFGIYNSEGAELDRWVSSNKPHTFWTDFAGEYIVREIMPPNGYKPIQEDIRFVIDVNGGVTLNSTTGSATFKNDAIEVVNEKYPTEVRIIKEDGNGQFLPGATLALYDSRGQLVETWVTRADDNPHIITSLSPGKYTLKEPQAPEGYACAEDQTFTIEADGTVKKGDVVVRNKSITITDKDVWELTLSKAYYNPTRSYAFLPGMEVKLTPLASYTSPTNYQVDATQQPTVAVITQENQKITLKCGVVYMFEETKPPKNHTKNYGKLFIKDGKLLGKSGSFNYVIEYSADSLETGTIVSPPTKIQSYLNAINQNYQTERWYPSIGVLMLDPTPIDGTKALVGYTNETYVYKVGQGWVKSPEAAVTGENPKNPATGARPMSMLILNEKGSLEVSKEVDLTGVGPVASSYLEDPAFLDTDFEFSIQIFPNVLSGLAEGTVVPARIEKAGRLIREVSIVVSDTQSTTFTLKNREKLVIADELPLDTRYLVKEVSTSGLAFGTKINKYLNNTHEGTIQGTETQGVVVSGGIYRNTFVNTPLVALEVIKWLSATGGLAEDPNEEFGFQLKIPYHDYYAAQGLTAVKYDAQGTQVQTYAIPFVQGSPEAILNFVLKKDEKIAITGLLLGTNCQVVETGSDAGFVKKLVVTETDFAGNKKTKTVSNGSTDLSEPSTSYEFSNTRSNTSFRIVKKQGEGVLASPEDPSIDLPKSQPPGASSKSDPAPAPNNSPLMTATKLRDFDFMVEVKPDGKYLKAGDVLTLKKYKECPNPADPLGAPLTELVGDVSVIVGTPTKVQLGIYDNAAIIEYLDSPVVPVNTKLTVTENKVGGFKSSIQTTTNGLIIDNEQVIGTTISLADLTRANIVFDNSAVKQKLEFFKTVKGFANPERRFEFVLKIDPFADNTDFKTYAGNMVDKTGKPLNGAAPENQGAVVDSAGNSLLQADGSFVANADEEIHFYLRDGNGVVIPELPYGVKYHLREIGSGVFTTSITVIETIKDAAGTPTQTTSTFVGHEWRSKLKNDTKVTVINDFGDGYELPESGGIGEALIKVIGGLSILIAAAIILVKPFRKRKQIMG